MSEQQQQPYVIVERHGSGFVAFVCGAAVGAVAALLLAPKTGRETQEELRVGAQRFREGAGERITEIRGTVGERVQQARADVEDRVDSARDTVRDRRDRAEHALKVGKDAAVQARADLEKRVAESKANYKAALEVNGAGETTGEADELEAAEASDADTQTDEDAEVS